MKEIFDLDIREMILKAEASPKPLRFVYAETETEVIVAAEEDIEDPKTRKILRTIKTGDIFESPERGIKGFVVECDPCNPLDVVAEILYKLQDLREQFPWEIDENNPS